MPFHRQRIAATIVGGAIGDVLGGIPERGSLSLSDDTQLTLATCEAIIKMVSPLRTRSRAACWNGSLPAE